MKFLSLVHVLYVSKSKRLKWHIQIVWAKKMYRVKNDIGLTVVYLQTKARLHGVNWPTWDSCIVQGSFFKFKFFKKWPWQAQKLSYYFSRTCVSDS